MKTQLLPQFAEPPQAPLYIFVDEHGNFDFSSSGTKYLILTALSCQRPFWWYPLVPELRYNIMEQAGADIEYFHATEDAWPTKKLLYEAIQHHCGSFRVDSIIAEKRKAHPLVRVDTRFYPENLGILLDYVITGWSYKFTIPEVLIITDIVPHSKKRAIVERALKSYLKTRLLGSKYRIYHHHSQSSIGLQIVDYCCWAIQRKWVKEQMFAYDKIKGAISSEFEVHQQGTTLY